MEVTGRPSPPPGRPDAKVRPRATRRVVIKRKVSNATFEKHKEQMENLGLEPSDPRPPSESLETTEDPDVHEGELPFCGAFSPAQASRAPQVLASKSKERKTVSLKTRTLEEQIVAGRYERALDRWGQQQQEWEKFRQLAAEKTGRDKEELVVTRAEEHRERLEVMELLDRATPDEIKSGGFNWYYSLRGEGTRFIQIGNMFSGLYLPMKLHKENYVHEIIRKPLMVDLTTARHAAEASGRRRPRSWRDDEYLLTRIRKYGGKMKELAPGLLEYDEIMEPEVKALHPYTAPVETGGDPEDELMAALEEGDRESAWQLEQDDLAGAGMVPTEGPHAEVFPTKLHFHAGVKRQCLKTIRLRNGGTAAIQFEWVLNSPEQAFQESVLPEDATPYFTCHKTTGCVLPGEDVKTMFSFTSHKPGTFASSWRLKTYPELMEPITDLAMNASATLGDLHAERRGALQRYMQKEQAISLATELAEDLVEEIRLQPPPLPPLDDPKMQQRFFEEANLAEGLLWSPSTWEAFSTLRDEVERLAPKKEPATGDQLPSFIPRPGRGRVPVPKVEPPSAGEPLPSLDSLGVPSLSRMRESLEQLPGTEPGAEKVAEKVPLLRELSRAARTARSRPPERSPLYWMAYETVLEIALAVPEKWAATRQRNGLEPLPFLPPPDEAEAVADYEQQLEERKAKLAAEEKEAEVREIFCRGFARNKFGPACARFGAVAKEATVTTRITQVGDLSLGDRLRPYLGRLSAESIEMASNVVLYELDLGFLAPSDGRLSLEGSDLELVKQRLRGVVSVLESVPLAVLLLVHLGVAEPDPAEEEPSVQGRLASLASSEVLLEPLREVAGPSASSIEFVPLEMLGELEFAQKVRNEDIEGKVYLLENLSAVPEEMGERRAWFSPGEGADLEVALHRLPWAQREGWAARALREIQPESLVQDALAQSCQNTTLSTGLWPRAPQRVVGPSIELELQGFMDTLQLPIRGTVAEEAAAKAELEQAVEDEAKAMGFAPLLVVLGGGGGEEALLKKLELMIGLSRLAEYEKGGVHIMAAGELACYILAGVLGMPMGCSMDAAIKAALREALLQVLRTGVAISLPLDVVCEIPEGEETEAQEAEKGYVVPLLARWKLAADAGPLYLGVFEGGECYASLDAAQGMLRLHQEDAVPEAAAPEAAAEGGAEAFAEGVPETWRVKDVGPGTLEQLRLLLRRSRGALWNGALGRYEEGYQQGSQEFITALESRLTGAGEEDEDEEEEEEEEEGSEEEEGEEQKEPPRKEPKERRAEFETALVLGRDSRKLLETLAENVANVPWVSTTGDGLLQLLRGAPLPGLAACDRKR